MILVPLRVDVPTDRLPIANWVIMLVITVVSILALSDMMEAPERSDVDLKEFAFLFDARLSDADKNERLVDALGSRRAGHNVAVLRHSVEEQIRIAHWGKTDAEIYAILEASEPPERSTYERMVLRDWSLTGLVGSIFLHADPGHLLGNMLFLWVFGNAVCSKVGNLAYPALFFGLGILAGAVHLLAAGGPAIGASGAINGIIGAYFIVYPRNDITMFYWLFVRWFGVCALSSCWVILMWLVFDMWGAATGGDGIAYAAHLGGFASGAVVMAALLRAGVLTTDGYHEVSVLDLAGFGTAPRKQQPGARLYRSGAAFTPPLDPSLSAPPPPPAPAERAAPAGIQIVCLCGKMLRVSERAAGTTGRCPACGQPVVIPGPRVRETAAP